MTLLARFTWTPSKKERRLVDIKASVTKHKDIMPDLLAMHALTGCDTVAPYHGIGKLIALRVLRSGKYPLSAIGNIRSTEHEILQQANAFIKACYGQSQCQDMTEAHYKTWVKKLAKNSNEPPKLKELPPTDEAFQPNALRGHLQAVGWNHAKGAHPAKLDPLKYGWLKDDSLPYLVPHMTPDGVSLSPDSLLRSLCCTYSSERQCKTNHCGCMSRGMACMPFCACDGGNTCCNKNNKSVNEDNGDKDQDDCDGSDYD